MVSARWEGRPAAYTSPATIYPITGWWMDGAFTERSVQFG